MYVPLNRAAKVGGSEWKRAELLEKSGPLKESDSKQRKNQIKTGEEQAGGGFKDGAKGNSSENGRREARPPWISGLDQSKR